MVVNPGSDDHLHIRKSMHEGLLSLLSKKQQHGKVSLNNVALGLDYKLSINMLMIQLYIAVRYFYIINRITLEEDYQAIYAPTATTKSDYLTKTIDGELIDINKSHWAHTRYGICTICVNEGEYWIYNLILPYINSSTPWIG